METLGLQGPRASRAGAPTSEGARPLICVAGSGHGSPAPARMAGGRPSARWVTSSSPSIEIGLSNGAGTAGWGSIVLSSSRCEASSTSSALSSSPPTRTRPPLRP